MDMVTLYHVRVIGGTGTHVRSIVENFAASLVTLELEGCDAEPQDFAGMTPVSIWRLSISRFHSNMPSPLAVKELELYRPGLDEGCIHVGVPLRMGGNLKRVYDIDTCRDSCFRYNTVLIFGTSDRPGIARGARSGYPILAGHAR
ncbi:hypothetical protein IW262DRAFT_1302698 [Armillaria fumosa]|nr:hypothetical protein IW262DRAFT_1302698 [Armillaria fumosa]